MFAINKMDIISYEEIISTLAKCGRPDLIQELQELKHKIVDDDYDPNNEKQKEEFYSEEEGSATSEEDGDFIIDEEGFHSLK